MWGILMNTGNKLPADIKGYSSITVKQSASYCWKDGDYSF
jgi:hypothetical protein